MLCSDSMYIFITNDIVSLQVDGLNKQHSKMRERARQRKADLESTLDKLKNYHNGSLKVDEEIERLIEVMDDQKPVANDVAQIQQQQEEFKVGGRACVRNYNYHQGHPEKVALI